MLLHKKGKECQLDEFPVVTVGGFNQLLVDTSFGCRGGRAMEINVPPVRPPTGRPRRDNFDDMVDDYLGTKISNNNNFNEYIN
ncbi:hypothetical protein H5410_026871 [Solanum commersonii]|uniref:Uncharacterized protein n=1 Tax=Solanum commersonii TaxID=4109 RepID=A0A9J5YXE5_SOLCO|nr:hypothetical protein H5410_026871 [Solanum commersonii]